MNSSYFAILDQLVRDVELQDVGDSVHEVDGEALKAVVALKFFGLMKV